MLLPRIPCASYRGLPLSWSNDLNLPPSGCLTQGSLVSLIQRPVLPQSSSSAPTGSYSGFSTFRALPPTQWSFPVKNSLSYGSFWPFSPSQSLSPPIIIIFIIIIIRWLEYPVRGPPQSPVMSTSCGPKYHSSGPLTRINGITHSGTSLPQA